MTQCTVCGEPMPAGEEMFKFHGYSGPCPKPPLPKVESNVRDIIRSSIKVGAPGLSDIVIDAIVRSAMLKIRHYAGVELSEENDRLTDALAKLSNEVRDRDMELLELADGLGSYEVADGNLTLADLLCRAEEAIRSFVRAGVIEERGYEATRLRAALEEVRAAKMPGESRAIAIRALASPSLTSAVSTGT